MMFFQVKKGRLKLVLFYCSADSDNSTLIKKDSKIGPMHQAALYPWERAIVSTRCQSKYFLTDPPPWLLSLEHVDKHIWQSLEIISKYTNPCLYQNNSLPSTSSGTTTPRRNLKQSANHDSGTLVLAGLNLRLGPGHHADTTSMMTHIPNPNFPPARGGLKRSTGLFCQHGDCYLN